MKNLKEKTRLVLRVCLLVLLANICTVSYFDGRLYAGVSSSLEQKILDQKVSLNFKSPCLMKSNGSRSAAFQI